MGKPIDQPTYKYLFAWGSLALTTHQNDPQGLIAHLRDNHGGIEVLPKVWLLNSRTDLARIREELFGTSLGRMGEALLCEIPNGVYAQGLKAKIGEFLARP